MDFLIQFPKRCCQYLTFKFFWENLRWSIQNRCDTKSKQNSENFDSGAFRKRCSLPRKLLISASQSLFHTVMHYPWKLCHHVDESWFLNWFTSWFINYASSSKTEVKHGPYIKATLERHGHFINTCPWMLASHSLQPHTYLIATMYHSIYTKKDFAGKRDAVVTCPCHLQFSLP